MQYHRFLDDRQRKALMRKCDDFYHRAHGTPVIRITIYFVIIILFTIWLLNNLMYSLFFIPVDEPPPVEEIVQTLGLVLLAALGAGALAISILMKVRQNVLEAEFQNLIFCSGMRVKADFCLVVHEEQTGFYCDYNFTELFADYGEHHHDPFHQLIASEGFRQLDEDRMMEAMKAGEEAEFIFTLNKKDDSEPHRMRVKLLPLERPKGFFLIQGVYLD